MGCTLLVSGYNMLDSVGIVIKLVINIENCSAGVTEGGFTTLLYKCFDDYLSTC
jgi:hypothetical protein